MTSAANSMMREKIAINDDNFFITNGGDTTKSVKFSVNVLNASRTITIPDNDVTLGVATSIAANNVITGGTNASSFKTTTGSCTVGDESGTLVFNDGEVSLQSTGAITIDSSTSSIGIGTDDVAQGINIGTGAAVKTITVGNDNGATGLVLTSGTGGITLGSTGTGDILINSHDTLHLDADGVLELNSSAGVISIGNDADSQNINVGTNGERTITVGNATDATRLVLTSGTGKAELTSTNTALDSIKLSTTTGGITLASRTSGVGAFGSNVDGTRFFKVDTSASDTTGTTFTFTGAATDAPYLVEVRTSIRDTQTQASGFGSIIAKACFNKVGNAVTNIGDSFETFGTPTAEISFGTVTNNATFTVTFKLTSGTNATNFDGSIMIHTEDTGVYRSA